MKSGAIERTVACSFNSEFSTFSGQNVGLLGKDLILRSGSRLECSRDPYFRSEALVSYLIPLWKEGLLLIRASVYTAVISGVCMLVWYGQNKAKGFIEANLFPYFLLDISVIHSFLRENVLL